MRRCQTEAHQHQHGSQRSPTGSCETEDKDESRLAKVKQVLAGTLLGRFNGSVQSSSGRTSTSAPSRKSNACCTSSTRVFGTNLECVESHSDTGVPFIVHRLCNYIEAHGFQNAAVFRLSSGSPRLAERLRISFEKKGDADLEAAACPPTAASLLRQYLKELPQPVVPSAFVARLLNVHAQSYTTDHETWIKATKEILSTLPAPHYRLLGYLVIYLSKYEAKHGRSAGICGVFAPVVLPHVPPATTLLRDILNEAMILFPDCVREDTKNSVISNDSRDKPQEIEGTSLPCALKPRKRKERRESCCQERKLIRSNSEERILENTKNTTDTIRRVSSQEDFHRKKDLHILSHHDQDMGHGVRCGGLPLHERTNVSPISKKPSPITSPCDVVLATERFECDAERLRSSERFSRSVTPRGRRQARRRKVHKGIDIDPASSKENEDESKRVYKPSGSLTRQNGPAGGGGGGGERGGNSDGGKGQSFLEMLSSGPSRSPSPARPPTVDHEDFNNPSLTNWRYQHRDSNVASDLSEDATDYVESISSPRNSLLIPRRFYADNVEANPRVPNPVGIGLKNLTKTINGLKKKIKKYEDEFEENFGYRPSHSDKMSNRDTKRLCTELHKLRKEYKILKEDPMGALITNNRLNISSSSCNSNNININNNNNNNNNNNSQDKPVRPNNIEEMVEEIQKKLHEKRMKYNRPENMEELSYEQLLDEKTAVQKALLQIEEAFGRPVSKDREVVRPLYDRYRSLKRQLIRASASNSIPELATILEHEAMNFTSSTLPGTSTDGERRSSEPDMSHSGILDCIEPGEQLSTDSDSQNSSSDGSRGSSEGLHALPQEELLAQQRATRQKKERLRKALKEWEAQFEARAGRRMQRRDRGPQVNIVYESYKQVKAKLKLIDALIAKNASRSI